MQLKYGAVVVSLLLLSACSPLHYTTDLNKVRDIYDSKKDKVQKISANRQKSILIENKNDNVSGYAVGIACLSEPYLGNMKWLNDDKKVEEEGKKTDQIEEIDRLEKAIKQITKTGGYQKIKRLNKENENGDILVPEGQLFSLTINQYAMQISNMDYEIDFLKSKAKRKSDVRKITRLMNNREILAFEMEELKTELVDLQEQLKKVKNDKADTDKILGDLDSEKKNANDVYKVSVANIYDKTGKVFKEGSTAISEMVAHALSYNYGIKLVDIPFGRDWSTSRHNPLSGKNSAILKTSPTLLSSNTGFTGVVFPSDMYISGALVQYDEVPAIKPFGTRISANIDPVDLSTQTRTITVGMVLRAVDSTSSLILDNANPNDKRNGERASVYVQNTYFVKKVGLNMFEIKSKRLYGGDVTVEVSDPATYAVKEMTEAGIYELLKKTIRPNEMNPKARAMCDNKVKKHFQRILNPKKNLNK